MKRLLLFLALFGSAVGIVIWLEQPQVETTSTERRTPLPEGDVPQGIRPGGELFVRGFEESETGEHPVRFELAAEESLILGTDRWELHGVVLKLYDTADGELMARLDARVGRATVIETGPHYQPEFDRTNLELEDVHVSVVRGAPVLPLTMEAPAAVVDLEDQRFVSETGASFSAPELSAKGDGLTVDLDAATLLFQGGGTLEIGLAGQPGATFGSRGPMRFRREASDGVALAPLTIEGLGGAEIDLADRDSTHVEASSIVLVGEDPTDAEQFSLRSALMEGRVVWQSGASVFRGDRGRAEFGADDRLTSARMEGLPSARLGLPEDATLEELEAATVVVEGEGPLEITNSGQLAFEMGGPATVATQGSDLRSNGPIRGGVDEAAGLATFFARGGVVLESEVGSLETAELDVEIRTVGAEERELRAVSRGGAKLEGVAEERAFSLTSGDRIEVRRIGEAWYVSEALEVTLALEGDEGFRARARRVADFDVAAFSFVAEGGISLEGLVGTATGESARVSGRRNYVLEGTPERPAKFQGAGRHAEALRVELDGDHLIARGSVKTRLDPPADSGEDERYELQCDELDVRQRDALDDANGLPRRAVLVEASGNVTGSIVTELERTDLNCDRIETSRFAWYESEERTGEPLRTISRTTASGHVDGRLWRADGRLGVRCDELIVDRAAHDDGRSTYLATATGSVRFEGNIDLPFSGSGERLVIDEQNHGVLTASPGQRVQIDGQLPSSGTPFRLRADEIRFTEGAIEADAPDILVATSAVPIDEDELAIRATACQMIANETRLELIEEVHVEGRTQGGEAWTLASKHVVFEGQVERDIEQANLSGLKASGGVEFRLGNSARATGDELVASRLFGTMRLTGSPVRIETRAFNIESEWVEFDPQLQIVTNTGGGRITPPVREAGGDEDFWSLEFLSSETLVEPDALVYVLQEPLVRYPHENATLNATWSLLWIDRRAWAELPERFAERDGDETDALRVDPEDEFAQSSEGPPRRLLFGQIENSLLSGLLREAYFEGPVQLIQNDDLVARADALYLDVVTGNGWMADVTVNLYGHMIGEDFEKLVVKAGWLHHTAGGLLRADSATVTTCDQDEPHIRIVTGDLRIRPNEGDEGEAVYQVGLRDNRVELYDLITIPLPPFKFGTDEDLDPLWPTMAFGNSARFGTLVSGGISGPADGVGRTVNSALRGDPSDYRASYSIQAAYLGSRGALVDLGLKGESKEKYWFDMLIGGLPDSGEDRGFIRVDEEDRDTLRLWYRAQGRYGFDEKQWIDASISVQTDAGVQSEFWESDFLRYEQSETFARWRRARDGRFYDATVKVRPEEFRSDIEELPSATAYSGRRRIAELGPFTLVHDGDAEAGYYRRRAGNTGEQSPFVRAPELGPDNEFADGYGDRDVLRFDTEQTLEVPIETGLAGVSATPFTDVRFTAWNEDTTESDAPTRVRAEAGMRLATTLWRRDGEGRAQTISPFVQYRGQLLFEENGGVPVPFDTTEEPIDGSFVDFGARGRFPLTLADSRLDVEVRGSYATSGSQEGWQPIGVFSRLDMSPFEDPLHFWYDGRFATEERRTVYSLLGVATRIDERLLLEASHHFGRLTDTLETSYEAVSGAASWRWTEKWEFVGRQTVSLLENTGLDTTVILRRYGHDVVFDIEASVRSGEGGGSIGISVEPRFGYRAREIGYLDY